MAYSVPIVTDFRLVTVTKGTPSPLLTVETEQELKILYSSNVSELEKELQRPLASGKKQAGQSKQLSFKVILNGSTTLPFFPNYRTSNT